MRVSKRSRDVVKVAKSMSVNEMTVKRKGGLSEVRRKTGSSTKVRWEIKEKSETKLDDRKLM